MSQRYKAGDFYLEVPAGSAISADPAAAQKKAEKPETPEPLEEPQYIYRPNDPFQSSIDEARAITSISHSHQPWVKKTWYVLFVIGPLVYAELFALSVFLGDGGEYDAGRFVLINMLVLPVWSVYYMIWRKKMKS